MKTFKAITLNKNIKDLGDFATYIRDNSITMTASDFDATGKQGWFIGGEAQMSLKKKIESKGVPLKDWDVKIYRGVLTGLNEAFIIDKSTKEKLILEDPKSAEIIKPILRGRDIKRYGYEFAELYILIVKFGAYKNLKEDYPAIYNHLINFEVQLRERGQCRYSRSSNEKNGSEYSGQHHWIELDNNPTQEYINLFYENKIIWPMVSTKQCIFSYLEKGVFVNNKGYIIVGENTKYILAVLNSSLAWYLFRSGEASLGASSLEIRKEGVENYSIPKITEQNKSGEIGRAHV